MARILVVDDEEAVRHLIRRLLEAAGHEVVEAENGQAGLERFYDTAPDLALVDMFMPLKDGFETIRQMRAARPHARIIAMSGGGKYNLDVLDGLECLGASSTLAKPFDRERLLGSVERVLGAPT